MILVVNPGSSSIKFQLFNFENQKPVAIFSGIAERIGLDGNLKYQYQNQENEIETKMDTHQQAVEIIYQTLEKLQIIKTKTDIWGIGFRIVHGGSKIVEPVIINQQIKQVITEAIKLAPLHNPGALIAIEAFEKTFTQSKLVACFDTSFHQTIPEVNFLYSVPYQWYEKYQVRKFGFHGISYQYVAQKMALLLQKPLLKLNLVICHLGNGASICAIKNGRSYNTSMGLTPLAGLMMGTRSGDIDPSILVYMAKQTGKDVFELTDLLNQQSGLLGISELSSDMRDISKALKTKQKLPSLAFKKYVQIIADFIIKFVNELNEPIDGIVFTAGIGENSFEVRQAVIDCLPLLNLKIDHQKNLADYDDAKLISSVESQITVYAVRTNEELLICEETQRLIKKN